MYRFNLWFIGLLVFSLAACTKTVLVPAPPTESDLIEDPVFSTLDFATPEIDEGSGLVVKGNNLYVVGSSRGDLDGTSQGARDAILRLYNGGKLWGLQFGTRAFDYARRVAVDSNGDVYVIGDTLGPLGFQVGSRDVFLAKFNKNGERVWIRQFGTKGADVVTDLAIDSNNRIYVLSDEGTNNFVIRKFHKGGSLLGTKSVTLSSRPGLVPRAMTVDSLNNLTVLTDWNNSGSAQGMDIRLFKYTSSLSQVWQRNYGMSDDEYAFDITSDSSNNIYFTLRVDAVNQGARFVKKNASGSTRYTRRLEYSATSFDTLPLSIATDSSGSIYIAGNTPGSFPSFSNAGFRDIVVFKYSNSGTEQWVTQFGNGNYGSAGEDSVLDIAVNGAVYITGNTLGNLLTGSATPAGGGTASDAYVAQLNKNNGTILGVDQ